MAVQISLEHCIVHKDHKFEEEIKALGVEGAMHFCSRNISKIIQALDGFSKGQKLRVPFCT